MPFTRPLTAAALALGLVAGAQPLLAQDAPEAATEAPALDDAKLEAFVVAALEVTAIQERAAADLADTTDAAEQQATVDAANAEMVETIDATPGITVDEYVQIAQAADADPALGERIRTMMGEAAE